MDRSIESLKKNKSKIIVIISVLMIIVSASIFPIIPTNIPGYYPFPFFMIATMILIRIQMTYVCYLVGKLIRKLYTNRAFLMFTVFFTMNAIGLLIRILIEWGETSLLNDLTTKSIVIHLILAPTVILISYLKADGNNVEI